jgi:hypothetical protein
MMITIIGAKQQEESKKKSKKETQYFTTSINNRSNILNGVTEEAKHGKAPSCQKVTVKKKE